MNENLLFVISGPSGVGKGTLLADMMKLDGSLSYSVSATTRNKRAGEVEGVHYYYKSPEEFDRLIETGDVLEWDMYQGNRYGTLVSALNKGLAEGKNIALDITVPGAVKVKELYADRAVSVFILPPSLEELRRRLIGRGREDMEEIERRQEFAILHEMPEYRKFDYVLVNDDREKAVSNLLAILHTEFQKRASGNPGKSESACEEAACAASFLTSGHPDILERKLRISDFINKYMNQ